MVAGGENNEGRGEQKVWMVKVKKGELGWEDDGVKGEVGLGIIWERGGACQPE